MANESSVDRSEENAEMAVIGFVKDIEELIAGRPELAVIYGNSLIAAVQVVFSRHGIHTEDYRPIYDEVWQPVVARILQN